MSVKHINIKDLLDYEGKEGLILQGCGGDPQEWIDGINELFTKQELLLDGTKFNADDCAVFDNGGVTCILYPFSEDVNINYGKLAMWRIGTHSDFGGTWLSDFVDQKFGGFQAKQQENSKPDCPLIGQDGNIFNLMGIAARTLRENGLADQAKQIRLFLRMSPIFSMISRKPPLLSKMPIGRILKKQIRDEYDRILTWEQFFEEFEKRYARYRRGDRELLVSHIENKGNDHFPIAYTKDEDGYEFADAQFS